MLKTNCDGCVFKSYRTSCELEQEVFIDKIIDKEYQFTKGYCGLKRNKRWLNQQEKRDLAYLRSIIDQEETSNSIILLATDNEFDKIKETVDSYIATKNYFNAYNSTKSIMVCLYKADPACLRSTVELISSLGIPWYVDNIQTDMKPHNLQVVDAVVPSVPANWFISLKAGTRIDPDYVILEHPSAICYYLDETDNIQFVCNKFAFMDLGGNMGCPFLDKLQQFDDWKEICYKIN